ncbi:MAG: universal stress protein [Syntrophales bacterium]|nr:universal stress protein [Syntrophales bacterium]MDY0044007.1 universal stress protein [Syntrophales bacterium]
MKIIVGYEGSRMSHMALDLAKKHAKAFGAEVTVITSLEGGRADKIEDIEAAKNGLEYAEELLKREGIESKSHLLIHGLSPGEDIVDFAKEQNADEIIVGVKMKSKVGKFLLGSNAQYVILNAHCPVVTIKL